MRNEVLPEPLESSLGPIPDTATNVSGTTGTAWVVSRAISNVWTATR